MLGAEQRVLLGQAIAPDDGYLIDHALITTFTLDLPTLLELPVALTFFEWEAGSEDVPLARIAMLDAIRRHIDHLTVVAEAGFIAGPRKKHPLFPLLEPAIHTVKLVGGTFHPKAYFVRYLPRGKEGTPGRDGEVRYRLVVTSRNLSQSSAWDTAVVLDGQLADRVQKEAKGLSSFVNGTIELAESAAGELPRARAEALTRMADEADYIDFELPDGVRDMRVHPVGFGRAFEPNPLRPQEPRMVMSPFLGDSVVDRYAGPKSVLVSRREELDNLRDDPTERYESVFVLNDLLLDEDDTAQAETSGPEETIGQPLRGLHAKLFLDDDGHKARMLIGSANATSQAFASNRELLLELTVSKYNDGVAAMVHEDRLGKFLEPYVRNESDEPVDEAQNEADGNVKGVTDQLARASMKLQVSGSSQGEEGAHDLSLAVETSLNLPPGVEVSCAPVTLEDNRYETLEAGPGEVAKWGQVPTGAITCLIGFRIKAQVESARSSGSCVVKVPVEPGLPEDRDQLLIRGLIANRSQLLQYLALLLAGVGGEPVGLDMLQGGGASEEAAAIDGKPQLLGLPLIERLIQAVDRDPDAVDAVARLIAQLDEEDGARDLLPEGFEKVWAPVLEARKIRREVTG